MPEKCPFCKIINGEQESEKVYEDRDVLAILDINPSTPGHTLVIPKKHASTVHDLSNDIMSSLFGAVEKVMRRIGEGLDPDGFNVGWNHGKIAGQAVPHLHIHVLPRFEGDKGGPVQAVVRNEPEGDLSSIAAKIRSVEKPSKQRSRVQREVEKKEKKKDVSPQEKQLGEVDRVPGAGKDSVEMEGEPEREASEEEEEEEDEEDERNKSAKEKWKEMKKARY